MANKYYMFLSKDKDNDTMESETEKKSLKGIADAREHARGILRRGKSTALRIDKIVITEIKLVDVIHKPFTFGDEEND